MHAYFSGALNENSRESLAELAQVDGDSLEIDLQDLKFVTSLGIRSWHQFLAAVTAKKVELAQCPSVFINQANAIPSLIWGCRIRSFFVDLYCDNCLRGESRLFAGDQSESVLLLAIQSVACADCELKMLGEVEPQQYLEFLSDNHQRLR